MEGPQQHSNLKQVCSLGKLDDDDDDDDGDGDDYGDDDDVLEYESFSHTESRLL
jgi:hypothetical protein